MFSRSAQNQPQMDVGWGSLVDDPLDTVTFMSYRRMLETNLDVTVWCKGANDPGAVPAEE